MGRLDHPLDRRAQGGRRRRRAAPLGAVLRPPGPHGPRQAPGPPSSRGGRGGRRAERLRQLLPRGRRGAIPQTDRPRRPLAAAGRPHGAQGHQPGRATGRRQARRGAAGRRIGRGRRRGSVPRERPGWDHRVRTDARPRRDGGRPVPPPPPTAWGTTRCGKSSTFGWRDTTARRSRPGWAARADRDAEARRDPARPGWRTSRERIHPAGRRRPAPDSPVRRVDAACDRFEAAWRAGLEPRIEDFLAVAEAADRPAMLRELLALETELRRAAASPWGPPPIAPASPGMATWSTPPSRRTPGRGTADRRTAVTRPTRAATCSSACWPCRITSSLVRSCWPPLPPGSPTSRGRWAGSCAISGRWTTAGMRCWRRCWPSISGCTATTRRGPWRSSARSARFATN